MAPKFEVGEVVILASMNEPEKNGEYSVLEIHDGVQASTEQKMPVYILDGAESCTKYWAETALKKKHPPGSLSFRDLMQTLKDPSKCQNA